jgi:hypothetical protein
MTQEAQDPVPKVAAGDLDLEGLWTGFTHDPFLGSRNAQFRQYLETITSEPTAIDDVDFCDGCGIPAWEHALTSVRTYASVHVCDSCRDSWGACSLCDDRYPVSRGHFTRTLDAEDVCDQCLAADYSYCEPCEGHYHDNDQANHDHEDEDEDEDDGSCCSSPQPAFTLRNNGCALLANDVQATITLAAGAISPEGLKEIQAYLMAKARAQESALLCELAWSLDELGNQWQARTGNFTKRLSSLAYKKYSLKLAPADLSGIGSIARDHSNPVDVTIIVTRDLNRPPGDFYHEGSCWWTSYRDSRCALKTNGGFGLLTFGSYGDVSGRAWVLPLQYNAPGKLVPTFETLAPSAFVVFNGYGELEGYAAPRVMAHLAGWTYRKIAFSCDPMYVNPGGSYLIAPEELTARYDGRPLELSVSQHAAWPAGEQAA